MVTRKVLDLARTKIEAAGLDITLKQGLGSEAPFPPASFDRVVSSLVFHHLTTEGEATYALKRVRAAQERARCTSPTGASPEPGDAGGVLGNSVARRLRDDDRQRP